MALTEKQKAAQKAWKLRERERAGKKLTPKQREELAAYEAANPNPIRKPARPRLVSVPLPKTIERVTESPAPAGEPERRDPPASAPAPASSGSAPAARSGPPKLEIVRSEAPKEPAQIRADQEKLLARARGIGAMYIAWLRACQPKIAAAGGIPCPDLVLDELVEPCVTAVIEKHAPAWVLSPKFDLVVAAGAGVATGWQMKKLEIATVGDSKGEKGESQSPPSAAQSPPESPAANPPTEKKPPATQKAPASGKSSSEKLPSWMGQVAFG